MNRKQKHLEYIDWNASEYKLLKACKSNIIFITEDVIGELIAVGANVNITDNEGKTALFYELQQWNNEILTRALVNAGADVNITDNKGKTALFYAVQRRNNERVTRALVIAGADVNITDNKGKTALFYAVQRRNNERVTRALVNAGADVNLTDNNEGKTALFYAVEHNDESAIRALVDGGADVNKTDNDARTALVYAVQRRNNGRVTRALVNAGADVKITDNEGKTALFYAIQRRNNERVTRKLVNAGADVNITDNKGKTALFYAVEHNDESAIRALVDGGADVNKTDNDARTALFYAVQQKEQLESRELFGFFPRNTESVVKALIDAGADVNFKDKEGNTLLDQSLDAGNVAVTLQLISAGAKVELMKHVNRTDEEGKSLLMKAIERGDFFSAELIIKGDADVNIVDKLGKSALLYAVQHNAESVVKVLIDVGADVNKVDNEGKTALFYAVQRCDNERVIRALVDDGVDVNITDNEGKTALFYAVQRWNDYSVIGDDMVIFFLLERGASLTLLIEGRLEFLSTLQDLLQTLVEQKMVSREQMFEAIISVAFNKSLSLIQSSSGISKQSFSKLLRIAIKFTSRISVRRRELKKILKTIEELSIPESINKILSGLVKLGANPNGVDSDGNTALHHAIQLSTYGVPETTVLYVCNELKKMGASFHIKNLRNETPLLHCLVTAINRISSGDRGRWSEVKTQLSLCRFLIQHGANVEEKTRTGQSALHLFLELLNQVLFDEHMTEMSLEEFMGLLREILKAYKEMSKDNNGNTPLHLWAKLALPPGQDYSITLAEGFTFQGLMSSILNDVTKNKEHEVDVKNNYGETPLHVCRTWTAVQLLLNAGANPKELDLSGRSPLLVAAKNNCLRYHGSVYPDIAQQPKAFWKTVVLEKGLDPWTVDKRGDSVMSILIETESFDLAKGMIEFACEENKTNYDQHIFSLLCAVCQDKSTSVQEKTDLVQIILESEKCPMSGKEREDSPLHFCCRNIVKNPHCVHNVHWIIAEKLLLYEANYKIPDSTGDSCLDIAEGCPNLKELLLKPIDINKVPLKIKPWKSISKINKEKLAYVARERQSTHVKPYWYNKGNLARGSFGAVFAGIHEKDGREVAIKRIERIRMERPEDTREITNLTALADCEQVVRYLNFFEDEHFSYIVLELMEGNLDQFLNSAIEKDTKVSLCQDVVKGLQFLHDHLILHRDLKPANILYKTHPKLCLKIADFGLSRRIDSTTTTTVYGTNAGTRCWIAPEVLTSTKYQHSKASDMFSCGLVLHYILSAKRHPFSPKNYANKSEFEIRFETERNVIDGTMEGWDESLTLEATNLLGQLLESDATKRPTAAGSLAHPLFWSKTKKVDLLIAVGNQPEFECPRAKRTLPLTAVETDLETSFNTIVKYKDWNDPGYVHMPAIYTEMTKKRKGYDTHSVVELVRFIRNAHAHVSESKRPTQLRKQLLEDFVFLAEYFPNLVVEVYKAVTTHGWDQTREEIKYALKKYD